MKRVAAALMVICMVLSLTGCFSVTGAPRPAATEPVPQATATPPAATAVPLSTEEPEETDEPEETEEPAAVIPETNVYASTEMGLTFTVPKKWVGRYRVEERDRSLTVSFNPVQSSLDGPWGGELFTILMNPTDGERHAFLGGSKFTLGGSVYLWGAVDVIDYDRSAPDYKTYQAMRKDIPAVFKTVRSALGEAPQGVKALWKEVVPQNAEYAATMGLGIAFTLPKSWVGKSRVLECEDYLTVSFKPKKASDGDGWLFTVKVKTPGTADDALNMGGVREITVNGVTYLCGGPTDVSYEGPEDKTFLAMQKDIPGIYDSIRAAK